MNTSTKNNDTFLKSILNKDTGFKVPENYFENSEDRLSSFLIENKFPKENGFKTSEGYFNSLEERILIQINKTQKTTKITSLKSKITQWLPTSIAATIALLLTFNYFTNTNNNSINFNNITHSDIEFWLLENVSDFSDDDVASLLDLEIINVNDFTFTTIKNDAIEEYILSTDNTSLLNETY